MGQIVRFNSISSFFLLSALELNVAIRVLKSHSEYPLFDLGLIL